MADLLADITDEELHERLARFGHQVTTKGKMTDAQRQIQKKKLNHLEAKERADREKAEKQAATKRAKDDSVTMDNAIGSSAPATKRSKAGSRRRTVAVACEVTPEKYVDASVEIEKEEPPVPLRSPPFAQRDIITTNKNVPDSSPLVIHLVDAFLGRAAVDVPVKLSVLHATKSWFQLAERQTNSEGGCPGLITKDLFQSGFYKIRINTEEYYKQSSTKINFPEIEVAVHVEEPGEKYTVSVLLMPNGYTATVIKNSRA